MDTVNPLAAEALPRSPDNLASLLRLVEQAIGFVDGGRRRLELIRDKFAAPAAGHLPVKDFASLLREIDETSWIAARAALKLVEKHIDRRKLRVICDLQESCQNQYVAATSEQSTPTVEAAINHLGLLADFHAWRLDLLHDLRTRVTTALEGSKTRKSKWAALATFAGEWRQDHPDDTPNEICAQYRKHNSVWAQNHPGEPTEKQLREALRYRRGR